MVKPAATPTQALPLQRLTITVPGEAVPQGSTKAFLPKGWTRPIITGDNPRTKTWRNDVQWATHEAQAAQGTWPRVSIAAIRLDIACIFVRPASVSVRKRPFVVVKPDADKLARSIGDALTGLLWRDDSQVVEITIRKTYAPADEPAHTVIYAHELPTPELARPVSPIRACALLPLDQEDCRG